MWGRPSIEVPAAVAEVFNNHNKGTAWFTRMVYFLHRRAVYAPHPKYMRIMKESFLVRLLISLKSGFYAISAIITTVKTA